MTPPAAACAAVLAAVCALASGCRALTDVAARAAPAAADGLPAREAVERSKSLPRTLPLEVRFVRHDPHDPAFGTDLWGHVDEQALDAALRRRLEANGLRAGVVTGPLPTTVAARLEPGGGVDPAVPEDAGLLRLLRLLPGKRAEVVAAAGLEELVLLEHGSEGVRGATYRDATALFMLQAWPDADGRVRIRVIPEVKHGDVQRSWVGEEGMFRLEAGQASHRFEHLGVTVRLPVGGCLLVGPAGSERGAIGDALLRDRASEDAARLLVLRPLAAAADPLFADADADADDER